MRVWLVIARDALYEDSDCHVVAAYSTQEKAETVASTFNAAVAIAEQLQEASGRGRIDTNYTERLTEVLRRYGDSSAAVLWKPEYEVEEFPVDPTLP